MPRGTSFHATASSQQTQDGWRSSDVVRLGHCALLCWPCGTKRAAGPLEKLTDAQPQVITASQPGHTARIMRHGQTQASRAPSVHPDQATTAIMVGVPESQDPPGAGLPWMQPSG